jgi:hypothetical protein
MASAPCRAFQVFPNQFSAGGSITAGSVVGVPGDGEGFVIRAGAPAGQNRLFAVVVPPGGSISDLTSPRGDMRSFNNPSALLRELETRVRSYGLLSSDTAGIFAYEIIP